MLRDDRGFTLIEMICVLVMLGFFATAVIVKMDLLSGGAKRTAITLSIAALNEVEKLSWNNAKAGLSYVDDETLFLEMLANNRFDVGPSTRWSSGPGSTGGTLNTNAGSANLTRTPSTFAEPGHWH